MSRFWSKIIKIQPKFEGSEEEASANVDSHSWVVIDMGMDHPEVGEFPPIVQCSECKALADTEKSRWRCGLAPAEMTVEEWMRTRR
jgi:hypothetical protein